MTTEAKQQTRILVQAAAAACVDKKGEETRILELDPIDSGLSDFFLVTSATNDRQAIAIADEIEHRLKKEFGVFPNSVEGRRKGDWILLDYVDFVVHVFLSERRAFYDIERLRKSARPLTPTEFDAELKAELTAKTLAVRKNATTKSKPVAAKVTPAVKTPVVVAKTKPVIAKVKPKAVKAKVAAKKVVAKTKAAKPIAKKTAPASKPKVAAKKVALKKVVAKKAAKKIPSAKKAVAVKARATKSTANKSAVKKIAVKKAPIKKSAAKKKK